MKSSVLLPLEFAAAILAVRAGLQCSSDLPSSMSTPMPTAGNTGLMLAR